jgi:hypothetical protein
MHRARASVPPDAIRIEDEVWQEAFTERLRSRRRLRALEGGRSAGGAPVAGSRPVSSSAGRRVSGPAAPRPVAPPRASRPATARAETHVFDAFDLSELTPIESPAPEPTPPPRREPASAARRPADPADPPARRTVTITGRGAERNLPWNPDAPRRRSPKRAHERAGFQPDRFAKWALLMGLLLLLVAATSAHL